MLHHKIAHETIFLTSFLIGSINDRKLILTNLQVVLIGLYMKMYTAADDNDKMGYIFKYMRIFQIYKIASLINVKDLGPSARQF